LAVLVEVLADDVDEVLADEASEALDVVAGADVVAVGLKVSLVAPKPMLEA
jgi:hypothetical protein